MRSYLNGSFANTACCILAPDGKTRLTRGGRSPAQITRGGDFANQLDLIAKKYKAKSDEEPELAPNFNSVKLAVNVSSADQRLLILLAGEDADAEKTLAQIAWSDEAIGRFQYDKESDPKEWAKTLEGEKGQTGILIVKPTEFGLKGEILAQFPFDVSAEKLQAALAKENAAYAEGTEKKVYSEHVRAGRRAGKSITMGVEFGEDRDGDGKIDPKGSGRRKR